MKKTILSTLVLCLYAFGLFAKVETPTVTPQNALKKLIEGNKRYVNDQLLHPRRDQYRREAVQSTQKPFACILACSDSRVSPEIVFDQGIGDLFVVRVAGNVISAVELESIKFSAAVLNSSIILVLGHENCGAVNAVLAGQTKDIPAIAGYIQPAVDAIRDKPGNPLVNAIKENVKRMVSQLKNNPLISDFIKQNKINVIGGYYNLSSGNVELLD